MLRVKSGNGSPEMISRMSPFLKPHLDAGGCVRRKPHPEMISILVGKFPCSCARIPCFAEKVAILLRSEFSWRPLNLLARGF
jgi:hypothetical protein